MKRSFPFHSFLFAFFFLVSPGMTLMGELEPAQGIRLVLLSVLINLVGLGICWLINRNLQHSAFACTLFWVSLGVTSFPMLTNVPEWIIPVKAAWIALLVLWALIAILIVPKSFWKKVPDPSRVTFYLNLIGLCSIAYSTFTIVSAAIRLESWKIQHAEWVEAQLPTVSTPISNQPDIYYIILDGYAREDVLRDLYRVDNSEFLNGLSEMGFYIAGDAHSNYIQTVLSLASSLNLGYLDGQIQKWGVDSTDRNLPTEMIRHSLARTFLESRGYRMVNIALGFYPTEIPDAEERPGPDRAYGMNAYEQYWILHSPFQALVPTDEYGYDIWGYAAHREGIIRGFDNLARISAESGSKFVFVHILAPHPPFVLREDGSPVEPDRPFGIADGDDFWGTQEEYLAGYPAQLRYINQRLKEIIPVIIHNSSRPVVIILQADHGPGSRLNWTSAEASCLWERTSIFSAYYLPEEYRAALYPSITPVNTFRLLFREIFKADFPPLEDVTSYSTWNAPYRMQKVSGEITEACGLQPQP